MAQIPLDHQTLFNPRLLERQLGSDPVPEHHQQLLSEWAATIRDGSIRTRSERQIRGTFVQRFFVTLLGYQPFGGTSQFTLTEEARAGTGSADVALGHFSAQGDEVVAPVELKGPGTSNLDIMMPGRHKSPVEQVWEYAMDVPGAKFLVLSNMLEIRLYAVGHTRRVYERFDLLEVAQNPREYHRLLLVLGADNLLGGRTGRLLDESAQVEKEITRQLYADYKNWRIQLIVALAHANDLTPGELIAPSQKLLDRVLFIAFAQQRGLMPLNTLQEVHNSGSAWAPVPKYDNYKGLFNAVDRGLPSRQIPPYNGGLFAPDLLLDALRVPDSACNTFLEFGKYDFGAEVSVYVLGHIFEQSISDLEELKALADTGAFTLEAAQAQAKASASGVSGARKEHGIVYTPEFVTNFIVEQALGATLQERRLACLVRFQGADVDGSTGEPTWRKATTEENRYASKNLAKPERVVELTFWREWLTELITIKVCDPACGSGAFLVAAFDLLLAEYNNVNEQIAAITGSMEVFNADREILNANLFGVDLNAESIEITKLSLWLKTARHGKPLETLDANLRVGNSIISSADGGLDYDPKAFDWNHAFPTVVAQGGFDVVIGNPPYVRMERLKMVKPYLEKRYVVATDRADLYCYFFELAIRLLRDGSAAGRLGFISSSSFFKTESGQKLRRFLIENAQIETVVDFGDLQVFEGVTTYPAIVIVRRSTSPRSDASLRFLNVTSALPKDFTKAFKTLNDRMPQSRLGADGWKFEGDMHSALRGRLLERHPTLREVYGSPLYGIKTGLNEAFVVNRAERDALIAQDPRSADLLKPYLEGKDLKRWREESRDLWIIYIPKGRIEIDDYPAIKQHLLPFKNQLERRATQQAWFELQQAQEAYAKRMEAPKLIYTRFMDVPTFWLDTEGKFYVNNALNFLADADAYEVGLLNSKAVWFAIKDAASVMSGGFVQVHGHVLEKCPIPVVSAEDRTRIAALSTSAQKAAEVRRDEIRKFGHMVLRDLAPGGVGGGAKLGELLGEQVPPFAVFVSEVKKRFRHQFSLVERNDWDRVMAAARERIEAQDKCIRECEREIDTIVYALFGLSSDEIALIEAL